MQLRTVLAVFVVAVLLMGSIAPAATASEQIRQSDPRFFAETGYRISNDQFWNFFQRRGGLRTFGYPVSREMTLEGFTVQFFQRTVMQLGAGGVQTMNLLDEGLLPYTTINGSTFPAPDPEVTKQAPLPSDPRYSEKVIEFTEKMAPDTWEGMPVNFFKTFSSTVTYEDAFPRGEGPASLLPLINLEVWGMPTSKPMRDPNNNEFVYLRFQRGIMHYDNGCKCTQGLLLADYLKALLTGENLPADLEAQASGSRFYRQYSASGPNGLAQASSLQGTNLKDAFVKQAPGQASAAAPAPAPPAAAAPPAAPQSGQSPSGNQGRSSGQQTPSRQAPRSGNQPYRARSPEYGMNIFLWGNANTTERDLKKLTDAGFEWQKTLVQWKFVEPAKGQFEWAEMDRIVRASAKANVKIIARLDFHPAWARRDNVHNGPPDNYQDYGDFVRAFVQRYAADSQIGRVHAIQIWNEPNIDREWGHKAINQAQAADYVRLLKTAYEAAKGADPSVIVITAGMAQTGTDSDLARPDDVYIRWMYEAGAKPYFDVLGAHGHGYKAQPHEGPDEAAANPAYLGGGHRWTTFRRVEDYRQIMVENGDADKQIWILEFGWTSDTKNPDYAWFRVSEEQKAENLVGAYQWAAKNWAPWIGVMTLWNLPDPSWTWDREEYWWSIANADGSNRPAYERLLRARKEGVLP